MLIAIFSIAVAEEAPITAGSTFGDFERDSGNSWSSDSLSNGCYKCLSHSNYDNNFNGKKEFTLDMPSSQSIMTVLVVNRVGRSDWNKRMGKSHIWVGNVVTTYSESLTKCSGDIFDTGFYQMLVLCSGSHVVIRRDGLPSTGNSSY